MNFHGTVLCHYCFKVIMAGIHEQADHLCFSLHKSFLHTCS